MIIKGPYKGYLGFCKEVSGGMARIELHTNAKIVSVALDAIEAPGGNAARGTGENDRGRGGFDGGKTPMYVGGRTPGQGFSGGKTPAWLVIGLFIFDLKGSGWKNACEWKFDAWMACWW